jgi:hypothetical protein
MTSMRRRFLLQWVTEDNFQSKIANTVLVPQHDAGSTAHCALSAALTIFIAKLLEKFLFDGTNVLAGGEIDVEFIVFGRDRAQMVF